MVIKRVWNIFSHLINLNGLYVSPKTTVYNHPAVREPRLIKNAGLNKHLCYIMERNRRKKSLIF